MERSIKIGAAAAIVVAGVTAGLTVARASNDDDDDNEVETAITGEALDKASDAALAYMGEGRVTGTEIDDEESKYEIEVTLDNGDQVDVQLDENFEVVSSENDGAGEDD